MGFFESHVPLESVTVMVQKEVADRMQGRAGNERLWGIVARRTILFRGGNRSECSSELFYAKTKCGVRRDSFDLP